MKKVLLSMLAVSAMLLGTSCSEDDLISGGKASGVSFNLTLEGSAQTKAISDGSGADKLVYAVYDESGAPVNVFNTTNQKTEKNVSDFATGHSVNIDLAKGQTYQVVFWAQDGDCEAYNTDDLTAVSINYEGLNNDETRDAFFKAVEVTVTGNENVDVELRRPFAQLNVGVTEEDWSKAVAAGIEIETSEVSIPEAATKINLLTGAVSEPTNITYKLNDIPTDMLSVQGTDYKYLSMCYFLPNAETTDGTGKVTLPSKVSFTFHPKKGNDIVFDQGLTDVPVQRNWRTNIVGKLLTGTIEFNVTIDADFAGEYNGLPFKEVANGVSYNASEKTYILSNNDGFMWFVDKTNTPNTKSETEEEEFDTKGGTFAGMTVKLTQDIDLTDVEFTPIATENIFKGTFDGGNNTISNLTVNVTDDEVAAGLFAQARGTVKNVKVKNVDIKGHYKAGAIVGDALCSKIENCHVDGGTITSTPDSKKDNANNVGGIAGYLCAEPGAWVKDCSVKNLTITAYRCVGGIAGRTNGATAAVENCVVDNVVVIADMLADYAESGKESAAGEIVGDNRNNADLSSNTTNNVTVNVYGIDKDGAATVGTDEQISYAISEGITTVKLTAGTYIIPDEAKGKTLTFVGTGNPADTKIVAQDDGSNEGDCDYSLDGATVTFNNVTITTTTTYYPGYARMKGIYNNCIINGVYTLYDNSSFTDCTFNVSGDFYNVWTWGATEAKFTGCTFNSDGKAMLLYSTVNTKLTIDNCVFNDNGGLKDLKAAIEIGNDYAVSYELIVNNTIVNGYEINNTGINTGTTLWANKNSMSTDNLNVVVDGKDVY